eukprot:3941499-Rhodomonas_salina.1
MGGPGREEQGGHSLTSQYHRLSLRPSPNLTLGYHSHFFARSPPPPPHRFAPPIEITSRLSVEFRLPGYLYTSHGGTLHPAEPAERMLLLRHPVADCAQHAFKLRPPWVASQSLYPADATAQRRGPRR